MEYGEVRSVVALKRGVGDHTPERFADHELGSCYRGRSDVVLHGGAMRKTIFAALLAAMSTTALAQMPPSNGEDTLACRSARGEMPDQRINPVGIPPFVLQQLKQRMERRRQDWQLRCDTIKREAAEKR